MNQSGQLSWQLTIIMCVMIVTFGGGTFALLLTGRVVPGELWPILGGIGATVVGIGGFFNMRQMHAAGLWHLAQATGNAAANSVPAAIPATTTIPTQSTATGTPSV